MPPDRESTLDGVDILPDYKPEHYAVQICHRVVNPDIVGGIDM